MRKINKMMAMVMLAVMLSLGTQTAFANNGVLVGDRHATPSVKPMGLVDMFVVYMKTGIVVGSNTRDGWVLGD
jgi:hypothetical protein